MSTSNTVGTNTTANGRKRSAAGKIVPALPLPMTKPRRQTQPKLSNGQLTASTDATTHTTSSTANPEAQIQHSSQQTGKNVMVNGSGPSGNAGQEQGSLENVENGMKATRIHTPKPTISHEQPASDITTPEAAPNKTEAMTTPPTLSGAVGPENLTSSSPGQSDLSSVRNALPPAFVPSTEQQTPQSTVSSRLRRAEFPAPAPTHSSRASTTSIVFGSHYSSSSSPAPPQANENPNIAPPFYPPLTNHSTQIHPNPVQRHLELQSTYPVNMMPPQNAMSWMAQPGPHQPLPHQFASQHVSRPSFGDVLPPSEPQVINGHRSRSASRSSSTIPERQVPPPELSTDSAKVMIPTNQGHFPGHFQGQRPPPLRYPPPPPDYQAYLENTEMLRDHIGAQFNNPDLADCHLQIIDKQGDGKYLDGHKIILSRSPTLLMLILNSDPAQSAALKTQVQVNLNPRHVTIDAFSHAIRYLYGEPLLTQQRVMSMPSKVDRMRIALEDAAVGIWLKLPAISARAIDMAASQMHWETINEALSFALEGGLSQIWLVEDSEDKYSTASSDDSYSKPEVSSVPTYDPAATQLLHRVIEFTLHTFPPDFFLDTSAPHLEASPRLPSLPLQRRESRQSHSDPRLSQIRFGEMAAHQTRPSAVTTMASSLLLSLPFPILKVILEHSILTNRLGIDTVASIMRAVIVERERRRNQAFGAQTAEHFGSKGDSTALQNLYWIESVEFSAQHRAGFKLVRRRKDVDTPASSGDGS